jgi:putative ABC transport system permease protein
MDLAIQDVRRHAGKFATTSVGVGLLLTVVLIMNGIYRGNTDEGVWLIGDANADLWVVERNRGGPFNEVSRLDARTYRSVAAIPGVARASPFIIYSAQRTVGGRSQQFSIVGYDVLGGMGGPRTLVAGRLIAAAHYELVADASLGLKPGDTVRLGLHDYRVVGLTKGAVDSGGNSLMYLALPDAQEVLYQQDNEALRSARAALVAAIAERGIPQADAERLQAISAGAQTATINAVLVKLAPGADVEAVRAHVEGGLYLSAFTADEERALMLGGRLFKMAMTLGIFRTLLVFVSIVIMALIVYVLTMEKIRAIATLKLIGASNVTIVRLILEQSLVMAVLAFAVAYLLVGFTHGIFPRRLVFLTSDTALTFAAVFVGGILASVFGVWRALTTDPAAALGG